ncbi:hypothetical protein TOPH_09018 [Tolypocladium ophioglossoides CBS 100239]|uniref:Uncharacterized protein n=1 Tax=Tolypocladium ophioglossoides (strain CBS 100239) TaxID=1163406 RepID=A0A0L0MWV4_TOLOC|nr:hypothetical protein TOPH_09018 [Tolypocladium ophioglossoides CBS 100239]
MNDTECPVQIPGFTHNGDCNLLCKPTSWKDILIFFLGNYGAHAATVIGRPGQSRLTWMFTLVLALCFPGTGVVTGLTAIFSRALLAPTELTRAARAGALCIVVKADEQTDGAEDVDVEASRHGPRLETSTRVSRRVEIPREDERDEKIREVVRLKYQESRDNVQGNRRPVASTGENTTLDGNPDEIFPPSVTATQVHGVTRLPAGYRLLVLPGWTTFEANDEAHNETHDETQGTRLSSLSSGSRLNASLTAPFRPQTKFNSTVPCGYNLVKILISISQLLFSIATLYETRGNQIELFGYAAFGLTVVPYVWMSFINLLGNLMCPQYLTMYVVNSPALDNLRTEVANKGLANRYNFDGTVGRISRETERRVLDTNGYLLKHTTAMEIFYSRFDKSPEARRLIYHTAAAFAIAVVPVAIVGGMSRFDPGRSATYQRV